MDYNFIDDPELKSILEKKSKQNSSVSKSTKRSPSTESNNSSIKEKFAERIYLKEYAKMTGFKV